MNVKEHKGTIHINTTPHPLNMVDPDGEEFVIPVSGVLINAKPVEKPCGEHPSGVMLVKTEFVADPASAERIKEIKENYPSAVIIGSIIAAQAFPGEVVALVSAPGFERVPPAEKKMRADKFTVF